MNAIDEEEPQVLSVLYVGEESHHTAGIGNVFIHFTMKAFSRKLWNRARVAWPLTQNSSHRYYWVPVVGAFTLSGAIAAVRMTGDDDPTEEEEQSSDPREPLKPTLKQGESASHTQSTSECKPIVLCGPSGAGKTTLVNMLKQEYPNDFGFSVSHTTRQPRPGEKDGVNYYYVDKASMEKWIKEGKFLEYAHVHGNMYGTSFAAIDEVAERKRICILDIDVQGVKTCKAAPKEVFDAAKYIFIAPPGVDELERRLKKRATEPDDVIERRVHEAGQEIDEATRLNWDMWIVNDNFHDAYRRLKKCTEEDRLICEKLRANSDPNSSQSAETSS